MCFTSIPPFIEFIGEKGHFSTINSAAENRLRRI